MGAVSSQTICSIRSGHFSAKMHPTRAPIEWPISVNRSKESASVKASRSPHPSSKE